MVLYYYCLRFDIAVGILREHPRTRWPNNWHTNLVKELVSAEYVFYQIPFQPTTFPPQDIATWFLASYASRQTVPPPVAICWSDLINEGGLEDSMEETIRSTHALDWDLFEEMRTILPEWRHQHSRPTFGMDNPWWAVDDADFHQSAECNTLRGVVYRASTYFNVSHVHTSNGEDSLRNVEVLARVSIALR